MKATAVRPALLRSHLALVCASFITTGALGQSIVSVPQLESCDGKAWAGIQLGTTTRRDAKKLYKTDRRAPDANAMRLSQPKDSPWSIILLCDGPKDNAKVMCVRLECKDAISQEDIGGVTLFDSPRYEDWAIQLNNERGVVAVLAKSEAPPKTQEIADLEAKADLTPEDRAKLMQWARDSQAANDGKPEIHTVIIAPADRVSAEKLGLSGKPTPVQNLAVPNGGVPPVAEFGNVSVEVNQSGAKVVTEKDREEFEQDMKMETFGGRAHYQEGASGEYRLTITATTDQVLVEKSFSGTTAYGPVSGSESQKLYLTPGVNAQISTFASVVGCVYQVDKDLAADVKHQVDALAPATEGVKRNESIERIVRLLVHGSPFLGGQ